MIIIGIGENDKRGMNKNERIPAIMKELKEIYAERKCDGFLLYL